ncbi:hypothetical protein [Bartonella sp. CB189]
MSSFQLFWGGVGVVSLLISLAVGNVTGAAITVVALLFTVI